VIIKCKKGALFIISLIVSFFNTFSRSAAITCPPSLSIEKGFKNDKEIIFSTLRSSVSRVVVVVVANV
jgi:hypothetical protein